MVDLDDHADGPRASEGQPTAAIGAVSVLEQIRGASFATSRRGYDRHQVDAFLSALASRLEGESGGFDPESVKRRLQEVGESTTGILTAAEETARKLQADASAEVQRLKRHASETAEHLRSEAREFAETTREEASEEARRLRMEASQKAEEIVGKAETRAEELLERSLERRRVLDANIEGLLDRRAEIADRLREMADELRRLVDDDPESPPEAEEEDEEEEPAPTRRLRDVPDFGFDEDDTSVHRGPQ